MTPTPPQERAITAEVAWPRVVRTPGALYGAAVSRKRRRCDGHMAPEQHWIKPGQQYVASALPPDSEIGNKGWWHHSYCMDCCPAEYAREVPR